MIAIKLREAMQAYKRNHGEKMTYKILAERTGIAQGTVSNIGSRDNYNATLATIEKICIALEVSPGELLEIIKDPPKRKRTSKKKKKS